MQNIKEKYKPNFTPLKGKVLVKRLVKENKTQSGIITNIEEYNSSYALVVKVNETSSIPVHSVIMFNHLVSTMVKEGDEKYILLNEKDVYGYLEYSDEELNTKITDLHFSNLWDVNKFNLINADEVLVKVKTPKEELEVNGIILGSASAVLDRPSNGIIVKTTSNELNVNDKIEFENIAGIDLAQEDNDFHYVLMSSDRVLGIYI